VRTTALHDLDRVERVGCEQRGVLRLLRVDPPRLLAAKDTTKRF